MSGNNKSGNSRGGNNKGGNNKSGNNKNSASNRSRSKKRKRAPKKKSVDPKAFWGDESALPDIDGFETSTTDPTAVVNSLGQPPLPGHGAASPHYFKLVYTRATQLASALAMAGGIDDLTPELIEEDADEQDDEMVAHDESE